MSGSDQPARLAAFCEALTDGARAVSCRHFRTGAAVDTKADATPVTRADRETEAFLRARIAEDYPDAGVFGEEQGAGGLDAELLFVVDPIDGTKSFITGYPLFGTLLAVLRHGRPVVGVIDMPALDERWIGVSGAQTLYRWAGRTVACATGGGVALAQSAVNTTSPDMFQPNDWARFDALSKRAPAPVRRRLLPVWPLGTGRARPGGRGRLEAVRLPGARPGHRGGRGYGHRLGGRLARPGQRRPGSCGR